MAMALGVKALPITFMAHVLAVAVAFMVILWCIDFRGGFAFVSSNKGRIFNIHPVMLIGFIILGGEAVISFKSVPLKKKVKKIIHLVLHATALILGCIGIYAVFKYHKESAYPDFYSLHSWLGIGIISLYGLQWIYGFVVFFFPGGSEGIKGGSLPWHVVLGMFVYVLAVVNAVVGFQEKLTFLETNPKFEKYGSEAMLVNFTAVVTILYGAFVVLSVAAQGAPEKVK